MRCRRHHCRTGLREATQELRTKLESAQEEVAAAERGVSGLQTEKEAVLTSMSLIRSRMEAMEKATTVAEEKV